MSLVPVVPLLAREPAEVGVAAVAMGTLTVLSAASAAASLAIARTGEERDRLGRGGEAQGSPERASGRRGRP